MIYPINYGFVPNTKSGDGEELDAYLLNVELPVESYKGVCIAIIHREDDNEDKLIIVPEGNESLSDKDILEAIHFQEQYFKSQLVRS